MQLMSGEGRGNQIKYLQYFSLMGLMVLKISFKL